MTYPKGCTFTESDWDALSQFWYPIAFSHDLKDQPILATLLDQRLVIWRTAAGVSVAKRYLFTSRHSVKHGSSSV